MSACWGCLALELMCGLAHVSADRQLGCARRVFAARSYAATSPLRGWAFQMSQKGPFGTPLGTAYPSHPGHSHTHRVACRQATEEPPRPVRTLRSSGSQRSWASLRSNDWFVLVSSATPRALTSAALAVLSSGHLANGLARYGRCWRQLGLRSRCAHREAQSLLCRQLVPRTTEGAARKVVSVVHKSSLAGAVHMPLSTFRR